MTQKLNVGMISLGCDKNRVDAELMLGILSNDRFNIVNDAAAAHIIIVNTCGFIESAKQESINTILEIGRYKEEGNCRVLIASGCLAERYSSELLSEIPELDAVVGVGNYMGIEAVIDRILGGERAFKETENINYDVDFNAERVLTTPEYSAYVKIAEGCNNRCSYCIIPRLRGIYRSRSLDKITAEVETLANNGTKEIILVAQDVTKYGIDLYGKKMLSNLLNRLSKIQGIEWIRLLYCYPEDVDDNLIEEIKKNEKVCKYIDIPLQHINDEILKNMRRISRKKDILALIKKLREEIPEIVIRTTFIVGFPGETGDMFDELYDFVRDYRMDKIGVFTYSQEEGTDAALFEDQVEEKTKKLRQKKLISLQKKISREKNKDRVGKTYKVLVESINKDNMLIGRTDGDSPEIDGYVYIRNISDNYKPGTFIYVKIVESLDYDLVGEVCYESCK